MQTAKCNVHLSDPKNVDSGMIVEKAPVTPAEVVILRRIHGHDAVNNIKILNATSDRRSHEGEMARLREFYTMREGDNGPPIVDTTFPGAFPRLPVTFKEIGIDFDDEPEAPAETDADTDGDGKLEASELKAALKDMGVTVKGNPKLETLKKMYHDALNAQAAGDAGDDDEAEGE